MAYSACRALFGVFACSCTVARERPTKCTAPSCGPPDRLGALFIEKRANGRRWRRSPCPCCTWGYTHVLQCALPVLSFSGALPTTCLRLAHLLYVCGVCTCMRRRRRPTCTEQCINTYTGAERARYLATRGNLRASVRLYVCVCRCSNSDDSEARVKKKNVLKDSCKRPATTELESVSGDRECGRTKECNHNLALMLHNFLWRISELACSIHTVRRTQFVHFEQFGSHARIGRRTACVSV